MPEPMTPLEAFARGMTQAAALRADAADHEAGVWAAFADALKVVPPPVVPPVIPPVVPPVEPPPEPPTEVRIRNFDAYPSTGQPGSDVMLHWLVEGMTEGVTLNGEPVPAQHPPGGWKVAPLVTTVYTLKAGAVEAVQRVAVKDPGPEPEPDPDQPDRDTLDRHAPGLRAFIAGELSEASPLNPGPSGTWDGATIEALAEGVTEGGGNVVRKVASRRAEEET